MTPDELKALRARLEPIVGQTIAGIVALVPMNLSLRVLIDVPVTGRGGKVEVEIGEPRFGERRFSLRDGAPS